jgi:pimeloyl-ACP methyl ester carboxylesterase
MGHFKICILAVLAIVFHFQFAQAKQHVCGKNSFDSVSFGWCIDYGDRSRNQDVLYVFHGSDRDENDWMEAPENKDIRGEWTRMRIAPPTAITISLGAEWLLTEVAKPNRPALYTLMVQKIMPFVESQLKGGPIHHRFLKGVSMGGYNGVELLLKDGQLFDRVALICPVIQAVGPFSPRSDIEAYIEAHKDFINRDWVEDLITELKNEFPTPAEYDNHDPLVLVKKGSLKTPHVYLSCGDRDEYGFFEGTEQFAKIAQQNGSSVIWQPTHGGHCVVDTKVLAQFFAP